MRLDAGLEAECRLRDVRRQRQRRGDRHRHVKIPGGLDDGRDRGNHGHHDERQDRDPDLENMAGQTLGRLGVDRVILRDVPEIKTDVVHHAQTEHAQLLRKTRKFRAG